MTVFAKRLMATCAVAALATTIYGCSSDNDEDRLRAELDVAQMEAAEATAETEAAKMEAEQAETELEGFRAAQMMREQEEQARMDAQTSAGLPGGMARSPAPAVYAMSDQDTLANLQPGGATEFSPLSVALIRQYDGTDRGTRAPDLGAAYVKSISADGMGGLRLTYVIDGEESVAHFAADQYGSFDSCCWVAQESDRNVWLWAWNDSFNEDPDDPAATDRTDGNSYYTYFEMLVWGVFGGRTHGLEGHLTFGARTMPENLPAGTATYEGTFGANIYYDNNPESTSDSWIRGALNLEADFDGNAVSGNIDLSTPDWNSGNMVLAAGNSIEVSNGMIDAGGFSADWAASGPTNVARHETVSGFEGTMVGEFYGPAAEEVGGVMRGHRAGDGSNPGQNLIGMFGGSQPEPEVDQ